jgi:DNA-binding CsgD family transcriptional regulator
VATVDALIERDVELGVLGDVVDAAAAGRGGAVLIEGEAGIGKTRLMRTARARAQASGARVLYGTADEFEANVPLAAARELLAQATRGMAPDGPARLGLLALDGALADPSGPGSRSDEVVNALWWLIVELADDRPLVLFLDDAQWADDLTLRLLRTAARRAIELPLALAVAARPAGPGHRHAGLAAEPAFVRLEPAPLSVAGTARLIESVLARPESVEVVARARSATGGNPLYLRELSQWARAGGVGLLSDSRPPPQLVRLVGDRLDRLTAPAGAFASAVAVLGAEANHRRARALAGLQPSDAIAAEAELRVERVLDADRCTFAHPLIAAAAREAIGKAEVAEWHARAAALLADDGVADQHVAEHLLHAPARGDAAVVATLRRAADLARRIGGFATAARLLERAAAEPPATDIVDLVEVERGRSLLDAGDEDGARVLIRVAQRAADASVRVDAALRAAKGLRLRGRGPEAVALLRGVLDTLADGHREMRLELLVELAFVGASAPDGQQDALRMITAEAGSVTGQTPGERLVEAAANVMRGESPATSAAAARELLARRLHRDYPNGFAVGSLTFSAIAKLMNADALEDAERAMDAFRADAEERAQPDLIAGALWQQAQIAYQRGDLPRCELEARGAIEAGGDFARGLATPWLVMVLAEQDRLEEAEQSLGEAGLLGPIAASILLAAALGSRGRLRLAQGDARGAVEDLGAVLDRNAAYGLPRVEPPWRPLLAEALVLADRTHEAAEVADTYATLAAQWGTRRALGHAARMRALVAPREHAISLLEEARTHFAASHARLELARCLTELGARQRAGGERRAARAILRDAHDTAYVCRASALCERARAELLLAGGRPRPAAGAGLEALTPAERRVADIAASGATNREIARRLYLSPKTIEMHLRSAYRKLDLPGREGLAAALH